MAPANVFVSGPITRAATKASRGGRRTASTTAGVPHTVHENAMSRPRTRTAAICTAATDGDGMAANNGLSTQARIAVDGSDRGAAAPAHTSARVSAYRKAEGSSCGAAATKTDTSRPMHASIGSQASCNEAPSQDDGVGGDNFLIESSVEEKSLGGSDDRRNDAGDTDETKEREARGFGNRLTTAIEVDSIIEEERVRCVLDDGDPTEHHIDSARNKSFGDADETLLVSTRLEARIFMAAQYEVQLAVLRNLIAETYPDFYRNADLIIKPPQHYSERLNQVVDKVTKFKGGKAQVTAVSTLLSDFAFDKILMMDHHEVETGEVVAGMADNGIDAKNTVFAGSSAIAQRRKILTAYKPLLANVILDGFNLFLAGVGSKAKLVHDLAVEYLAPLKHCVCYQVFGQQFRLKFFLWDFYRAIKGLASDEPLSLQWSIPTLVRNIVAELKARGPQGRQRRRRRQQQQQRGNTISSSTCGPHILFNTKEEYDELLPQPPSVCLIFHSIDKLAVETSGFVKQILLPVFAEQCSDSFRFIATMDDLRWETQLLLWDVGQRYSDKVLSCGDLHTLEDYKNELVLEHLNSSIHSRRMRNSRPTMSASAAIRWCLIGGEEVQIDAGGGNAAQRSKLANIVRTQNQRQKNAADPVEDKHEFKYERREDNSSCSSVDIVDDVATPAGGMADPGADDTREKDMINLVSILKSLGSEKVARLWTMLKEPATARTVAKGTCELKASGPEERDLMKEIAAQLRDARLERLLEDRRHVISGTHLLHMRWAAVQDLKNRLTAEQSSSGSVAVTGSVPSTPSTKLKTISSSAVQPPITGKTAMQAKEVRSQRSTAAAAPPPEATAPTGRVTRSRRRL